MNPSRTHQEPVKTRREARLPLSYSKRCVSRITQQRPQLPQHQTQELLEQLALPQMPLVLAR